MVFMIEFFEKVDFEKNQLTTKKHENYPVGKGLRFHPTCNHRGQSSVYSMPQSNKSSLFKYIIWDGILLSWAGPCECNSHACITGQSNLEKAALLCLQMIEDTLEKEDYFVAMVRESGSPILATPMDRLLLGINPKTGKADYIVTIAK